MVEVIGFIISLLALLYLFIKHNHPSSRSRSTPVSSNPVDSKEEGDDFFQEFMKAIEKETASREAMQHVPPPAPPKIKKEPYATPKSQSLQEYQLKSQIENRQLKSSLQERHIQSKISHREELPRRSTTLNIAHAISEEKENLRPSRVQLAIQRLNKRQDILIYQEVMSRPKAFRTEIPFP